MSAEQAAENAHPHRIVVERDNLGVVESVRFVCDGNATSPCHSFPDCGCEVWTRELHGQRFGQPIGHEKGHVLYADRDTPPAPGHENVVHENECWVDPWFNAALSDVADWVEAFTGEIELVPHPDGGAYDDRSWLVSGPVDHTWEGDYMTWDYYPAPRAFPPGQVHP